MQPDPTLPSAAKAGPRAGFETLAEAGAGTAPEAALEIDGISKTYDTGFTALRSVSLTIRRGELFALLGPNGAGKTTLISIICGLVRASSGTVRVHGHHWTQDYRAARRLIGLVPQELTTESFETVWATVTFSRGLFGLPKDPARIEQILKDLSLWEKRNARIMTLSGGMKRRVLIAKALAHEPKVLFLDEPTAGVDVELRRDMWDVVRRLKASGVTIILTTHYIEEAEEMADRVGVITRGEIILVEEKQALMRKLGRKQLVLHLVEPLARVPESLAGYDLSLGEGGGELTYTYDSQGERGGITALMSDLRAAGVQFRDLQTRQDSLEKIFVNLVRQSQ
ncbi:ATP-binding cassette domain-containing protein [Microvirga tunisiensis]|uniref:ATP-binding cassette domain-containing protein n=2 Tax=Pannonibacter tanglangensis TaxID=2750084 RepID=A0ABW9ZHK3_9HYPH|nr:MULTISPECIES: ABC transporter ATP-binding protein [unclassified Pannonibacter]NBN63412.1 ATP-binding cassette domain-containing protein [Pannonibacter sp. XCT-34]NBN77049.1 ATP-binding cassette domain-containing protein [Pannonibacter sp. XCT-53]